MGNPVEASHYRARSRLEVQRDVYHIQLQRCQNQIHGLIINRHLSRANDPGKDNIVLIIENPPPPEEDGFYKYPYYIARLKRRFITTKQWFRAQYPPHGFIVEELDKANGIDAFSRFKEEGYVERFQRHFQLSDLACDALYALGTHSIQDG